MFIRAAALAVAVGLPCAASHAAIFFTFQDPGPEREFTLQENGDNSITFLYSLSQFVSLSVTSDSGDLVSTTFAETRVSFSMKTTTTPIVDQPGLLVANLSGVFTFEDMSGVMPSTILTGTFDRAVTTLIMGQSMGTIEASGSVAGDSVVGSLSYVAGDALLALLDAGDILGGRQTASFALSELTGGLDGNGLLSMLGSAAFTGSSEVVPTPGALALFGIGAVSATRRRR